MSIQLPPKNQQYVFYVFPSLQYSGRETDYIIDIYSVDLALSWNTYLFRMQVVYDHRISLASKRYCVISSPCNRVSNPLKPIVKTQSLKKQSFTTRSSSFHPRSLLLLRVHSCADVRFQEMLDGVRKKHFFKSDEYQTMLNLQCGVDPSDATTTSKAIDDDYNSYVVELHELEVDNISE